MLGMVANIVTFSNDVFNKFRTGLSVLTNDEKSSRDMFLLENLQNSWCPDRIGTVDADALKIVCRDELHERIDVAIESIPALSKALSSAARAARVFRQDRKKSDNWLQQPCS